jgi:hypothetical protein
MLSDASELNRTLEKITSQLLFFLNFKSESIFFFSTYAYFVDRYVHFYFVFQKLIEKIKRKKYVHSEQKFITHSNHRILPVEYVDVIYNQNFPRHNLLILNVVST